MASAIGTEMTQFALTIWIWQATQETTAIALISFFFQLPQILIALFAGLIIDRFSRKYLMIFSDVVVALCTLLIGLLYSTQTLQLWHLYSLAIAYGCCGQIQTLAFTASISSIVPKQHYARVTSLKTLVNYSSAIIAPALVGLLYPTVGLLGIIAIDIATFAVGIFTVFLIHIPQTFDLEATTLTSKTIWKQLTWGIRYILARPSLQAMTIVFCLFLFTYHMSETLYQPLILARTGGSAQVLSTVVIAAGIGGVVGAVGLSIFGGFQRQVRGMLLGFVGTGVGSIVLGLGRVPSIWIGAQFFAALNIPLVYSSSYAVWYAKVKPDIQGRVLAAAHTIGLIVGAVASLVAGPLADQLELTMTSGGWIASIFAPLVGTGSGAGIALLYITISLCMVLIGVGGFAFPTLRNAEDLLPDYDRDREETKSHS